MKLTNEVDKRFASETEMEQIVVEIVKIDENNINREIALI